MSPSQNESVIWSRSVMPLILLMTLNLWRSSASDRPSSLFRGWPLLNKLDLMNMTQPQNAEQFVAFSPREAVSKSANIPHILPRMSYLRKLSSAGRSSVAGRKRKRAPLFRQTFLAQRLDKIMKFRSYLQNNATASLLEADLLGVTS